MHNYANILTNTHIRIIIYLYHNVTGYLGVIRFLCAHIRSCVRFAFMHPIYNVVNSNIIFSRTSRLVMGQECVFHSVLIPINARHSGLISLLVIAR